MPEPDSPDAQTPSAKADLAEVSPPSAPDDEQDLQEDAAAEAEEADTAGPLGISASLDGAAPDPFAALPEEEEDSPFGLPQDTTPKKKSLRGLFSRRGP
jgi:hypothetical protein